MTIMISCYDLSHNPPTYDVVTHILRSEIERIARRDSSIQFEIVPGPDSGFRRDKTWPRDPRVRRQLLDNIVVPMMAMLPACTAVSEKSRARAGSLFAGQYSIPFNPHFLACVAVGCRPLRPEYDFIYDPKLVTMTLRECEHWPERNSTGGEWLKAADQLVAMGYRVAVVRDTRLAAKEFGDHVPHDQASNNLELRGSLYRSAASNLFVNNGPAWFAMACDAPMTMIRPHTASTPRHTIGIKPGEQMVGAPDYQRFVWDEDRADVIINAASFDVERRSKCKT